MRNLKKVLTLVLTLAMLLSVMVVGAGAATFGDQDSITNKEAVDVCTTLNIIGGYEDGTFRPAGNVTRAEMSKMICVALNGGKEPTMGSGLIATFNDVAKDNWAAPYIEYCVSQGIVGGVGGGNFNPNGNITGTQAAKMLLCILGYNASIQGYVGSDYWETNINVDAAQKGLYAGLSNIDASAPLTRDQAAQMIWNALNAYEVEYITTLVTGPNGELTSKVTVQDRYDSSLNKKIDLLADKYEAKTTEGILYYGASADYNSAKGEYTYTIDTDSDGTLTSEPTYTTTTDYTDLYMHNVKVLYKQDNTGKVTDVYGIYSEESTVIASGVLGDIELTSNPNEVKVDGTTYKLTPVASSVDLKANLTKAAAALDTLNDIATYTGSTDTNAPSYTFDLIDNTGDNKGDVIVVYPFTVAEVTYVGSKSFNVGTSYDFEDVDVYDGIAKDDWVKITADANAPTYTAKIEKLDEVSASADAVKKADHQVNFGSTWFDTTITDGKVSPITPTAGKNYKYVAVNGYLFNLELDDSTLGAEDYVLVTKHSATAAGLDSTYTTQIMKSDGTKTTVEVKTAEPTNGALYTFEIDDDGIYELTAVATKVGVAANDIDFDAAYIHTAGASANGEYTLTYGKASGSDGRVTVAGKDGSGTAVSDIYLIDDSAIVFVDEGGGDYSVTTGAKLKTVSAGSVTTTNYVAVKGDSASGYSYIQLAYVDSSSLTSSDTKYAYVTGDVEKRQDSIDDSKYYVTIPVGSDSPLTTASKANSATLITNAYGLSKGDVFSYTLDSDGKIDSITVLAGMKNTTQVPAASQNFIAAVVGIKGDDIRLSGDYFTETTTPTVKDASAVVEATLTDDTVIIYVNEEDNEVVEGGSVLVALSNTINSTTSNYANVKALLNSASEVELLIVDTHQDMLGLQ